MMKRALVVFFLFTSILPVMAQDVKDFIAPVWKDVKVLAETRPDSIRGLVVRMAMAEPDTTLTLEEAVTAYCGQSFLSDGREWLPASEAMKAQDENRMNDAGTLADSALAIKPLSLKALKAKAFVLLAQAKGTPAADSLQLVNQARTYIHRMWAVMYAIGKTGDGTKEHPFFVIDVADEYDLMGYLLEVDFTKQMLVCDKNGMNYDVFMLKDPTASFPHDKVYFEISRVLEIERRAFSGK